MEQHFGHFVWRELMTNDVEGARAFYTALLGWQWEGMATGDSTCWVAKVDGRGIGGVMVLPDGVPMPCWGTYLSVQDIDRVCEAASSQGGKIELPPKTIPGVGRIAAVQDPQGAVIMLMQAEGGGDPLPETPPPGTFCWETLNTSDPESAVAFYTNAFPFKKDSFGGMPALAAVDGKMVADVEKGPPGVPPHWLLHVAVRDLTATRKRVGELGGKVLMPEIPIPDVGTMCIVADTSGAMLSLFEPLPCK